MNEVKVGQIYRHFKGSLHTILNIALDSETTERMIVYDHVGTEEVWVRPEKMFLETIPERPDNITGQKVRFELVDDIEKNYLK